MLPINPLLRDYVAECVNWYAVTPSATEDNVDSGNLIGTHLVLEVGNNVAVSVITLDGREVELNLSRGTVTPIMFRRVVSVGGSGNSVLAGSVYFNDLPNPRPPAAFTDTGIGQSATVGFVLKNVTGRPAPNLAIGPPRVFGIFDERFNYEYTVGSADTTKLSVLNIGKDSEGNDVVNLRGVAAAGAPGVNVTFEADSFLGRQSIVVPVRVV